MSWNFILNSFLGLGVPYDQAKIAIIGCPMDDTSSYRPGSRFGPKAIRDSSLALETYSPSLGCDVQDVPLIDMGDLDLPIGSKERALDKVGKAARDILKDQKILLAIGGEHLISLPLISEAKRIHKSLKVIHLDAHADLRNEYQGESLSHSTVMRRALEVVGAKNLYQIGIRSGTKEEFNLLKTIGNLYECMKEDLDCIVGSIGKSPCYLSLDLDILDPGIFPATGVPEPGGITFNQVLNIIYRFQPLNMIGIDIVEYNPLLDISGHCAIIAAKLIREIILLFFRN